MVKVSLSSPMTQAQFGALVGISQPAVSEFMKAEGLGSDASALRMLRAYCDRLRTAGEARTSSGALDLVQERAALAREQRRGHEMKNAEARRTYASEALLAETLAAVSRMGEQSLEQLPAQVNAACPDLPSHARVQVIAAIAAARAEWLARTSRLLVAPAEGDGDESDEQEAPEA